MSVRKPKITNQSFPQDEHSLVSQPEASPTVLTELDEIELQRFEIVNVLFGVEAAQFPRASLPQQSVVKPAGAGPSFPNHNPILNRGVVPAAPDTVHQQLSSQMPPALVQPSVGQPPQQRLRRRVVQSQQPQHLSEAALMAQRMAQLSQSGSAAPSPGAPPLASLSPPKPKRRFTLVGFYRRVDAHFKDPWEVPLLMMAGVVVRGSLTAYPWAGTLLLILCTAFVFYASLVKPQKEALVKAIALLLSVWCANFFR